MIEEGGDIAAFENFSLEDAGGEKEAPKQEEASGGAEASEPADSGSSTAPPAAKEEGGAEKKQESTQKSEPAPAAQESESTGERLQPSIDRESVAPAVKKLALDKGVPIAQIKGTGPGGRITKKDIENYKPTAPAGGASAPAAAAGGAATYIDEEPSSMRKTIASRLQQSMNENPHYFVASEISVSKLLKLRAALNASSAGKYKLSLNDFMVKAVAIAAKKVPAANSSWREVSGKTVIRKHMVVDVSVAVATPIGLMTPIVKNVGALGLESISSQIKDLGGRARDGKLKPEECMSSNVSCFCT